MYITYNKLQEPYGEKLDQLFQRKNCLIEVNPGRVLLPEKFKEIGEQIRALKIRKSDVWLISYPRTGSTWAQEMIWLLGHDLDYAGARQLQAIRTPLLELTAVMASDHTDWTENSIGNSVQKIHEMPDVRYAKSHLPRDLLPKEMEIVKPKVIYIARNPKDMCVSYYHYCVLIHNLHGTFEEFCELFLEGMVPVGPIWNHILGFWELRDEPNVMFLRYEDMKRNLRGTIDRTAKFLGTTIGDADAERLCEHLSFHSMKANPAVNLEPIMRQSFGDDFLDGTDLRFIRRGEVGDWRNYMTDDMSQRFDKWTAQHLKGTGLDFD